MSRRDPWFWQRVALELRVGNPTRKLILTAISRRIEVESGRGFVPQEHLAVEAECDTRTVRRHLKVLEDEGFIRRYRRSNGGGHRAPDDFEILLDRWEGQGVKLSGREGAPTGQSGSVLPDRAVSGELPVNDPSSSPSGEEERAREPILTKKGLGQLEAAGFEELATYHADRSGRKPPRRGTSHRAELNRRYAELCAEGYSLEDLQLAVDGVLADEWMQAQGYTALENVLRKTRIGKRIEDGRRWRARQNTAGKYDRFEGEQTDG